MYLRLLFLVVLLFSTQSFANTWRVEKDGTGDFTVIQYAVDAAASGDTIRIGSGIFDDNFDYIDTRQRKVRILIESKDLAIIGQPDGSTVIGPETMWEMDDLWTYGILVLTENKIFVQNIHLRNLRNGYITWAAAESIITNCRFVGIRSGAFFYGGLNKDGNSRVVDCDFFGGSPVKTTHVTLANQDSLIVGECNFEFSPPSPINSGIVMTGGQSRVANCKFTGAHGAIQIDRGASVKVQECSFFDNRRCFSIAGGARVFEAYDCFMANNDFVVYDTAFHVTYPLIMERSIVSGVKTAVFVGFHFDLGYVRDCVFSKGEKGVVLFINHQYDPIPLFEKQSPITFFDMRNNYWGTANPDSIQAWIDDSNDDPEAPYTILWEPFKRSLSDIDIDIKPESDTNPINCKPPMKGIVPVAVLGSDEFDVSTLDQATARFGPDEAMAVNNSDRGQVRHSLDINRDGHLDLMFHFSLAETGIICGDTGATLTGETFDGKPVIGSDVIRTVPKGEIDPASDKVVAISPNPFNPMTLVSFKVEQSQRVSVSVYDMRGRLVADLIHQQFGVGEHTVVWKGQDSAGLEVPSGAYFFRVEMGDRVETQKALLLR